MPTPDFSRKGYSQYGAQMGRHSGAGDDGTPGRGLIVRRVHLDSGGYDDGGAYWGRGARLYCGEDTIGSVWYVRAADHHHAREIIRRKIAAL